MDLLHHTGLHTMVKRCRSSYPPQSKSETKIVVVGVVPVAALWTLPPWSGTPKMMSATVHDDDDVLVGKSS